MKKVCFLAVVLIILSCTNVFAKKERNRLSVELKMCFDNWTVRRIEYGKMLPGLDYGWDAGDDIEVRKSNEGILLGPGITYSFNNRLFARAHYLISRNEFDVRIGNRKEFDFSVGYIMKERGRFHGGFSIGYRDIDISFLDWESENIVDHSISDIVLGISLLIDKNKKGFNTHFDMTIGGIRAISEVLSEMFSFDIGGGEIIKNTLIAEGEFSIGYKFAILPVDLDIGYRIWGYDKTLSKQENHIEKLENKGHGATAKITYCF